jgi:hypothetical protein
MLNAWSFWLHTYLYCLQCAEADMPVYYYSRIDGALLPQMVYWD